jgi:hypothetical protein
MDKLNLQWEVTELKGIKQYLHFMNPLASTKLSPMEVEVLSAYLYVNNLYKDFPKEVRDTMLFSKDTRKKMVKFLDTSGDAFNNTISSLYRKGYLSKEGKLKSFVPLNDKNEIEINLKIKLKPDATENFMND